MTTKYGRVASAAAEVFGLSAAVIAAVQALERGDMSGERFVREAQDIDRKLADSAEQLQSIRWPRMDQQRNHAQLIVGVKALRSAIMNAIGAAHTGNEAQWFRVADEAARATRCINGHMAAFRAVS
ncbi:hypothetical protein [Cohnella phaseoli]|uniref:Uncharacterized protein n=1 Tax=Cohnella phaseoli TaxID=456490 RepID=A0A3D9KJ78_9BACL|nr:hypothetical protein [Cohnella phaseoli]RED86207.1 hypothetical protein DFP98_10358 [Cohnella phaseoli]